MTILRKRICSEICDCHIINYISDIKGIRALKAFKILDAPGGTSEEA
jgi:hypothetical protein